MSIAVSCLIVGAGMGSKRKTKPDDIRAAAKLLYETTPLTLAEVANEVGLGERTVKR